jgi:hypothetical protein
LAASIKHGATATPLATLRYATSKLPAIRAANPLADPVFAKLSQVSPEAFYYWNLVEGMTNGVPAR